MNNVTITGKIIAGPTFSHLTYDEKFFESKISVDRLSGNSDIIPIIVSERLLTNGLAVDSTVTITGQFRSYNKLVDGKSKLILSVFVTDIVEGNARHLNYITLAGYICKPPVRRRTPLNRDIADVMLAVNRERNNKSDYIPCILWSRNAAFAENLSVGDKICVTGRIQSREYQKNDVTMTAYEVSVSNIMLEEQSL